MKTIKETLALLLTSLIALPLLAQLGLKKGQTKI